MNKVLLGLLLVVLVAVGFFAYATQPLRIDGSSAETLEQSIQAMCDSLPENERAAFVRDKEDALADVSLADRGLVSSVAATGVSEADALRERVDGMTIDEFRAFAAERRRNKKQRRDQWDRMVTEHQRKTERSESTDSRPDEADMRWPDQASLLAVAPDVELKTNELEFNGRQFLIDLPSDATVEDTILDQQIRLATGEAASLSTWLVDLVKDANEIDKQNGVLVFVDENLHITQERDLTTGELQPTYRTWIQLKLSKYTHIGSVLGEGGGLMSMPRNIKLEPTLTLIRCLKTLRPKEEEPAEPLALAKALGIRYQPPNADSADSVTELKFPSNPNAATFRAISLFPHVRTMEFEIPSSGLTCNDEEPNPLEQCDSLSSLHLSGQLEKEAGINAVFSNSRLKELKLELETYSDTTWRSRLGDLKGLERLTLKISQDAVSELKELSKCQQLQFLRLVVRGDDPEAAMDLGFVRQLSSLREVELERNVPLSLLEAVIGLPGLERLVLAPESISEKELRLFHASKALNQLSLVVNGEIAPDEFKSLVHLPLKYLKLRSMGSFDQPMGSSNKVGAIGDEHLKQVTQIQSIEQLELDMERLTVAGLEHLRQLPNLKTVTLGSAYKLDSEALQKFIDSKPGFTVVR